MTDREVLKVMQTEKECVLRNIRGCDRECGKCDLVLPDETILSAYDYVMEMLESDKRH